MNKYLNGGKGCLSFRIMGRGVAVLECWGEVLEHKIDGKRCLSVKM